MENQICIHPEIKMSQNNYSFVGWEEHIICQERGNRVVHFYLKEASGILVLAVVGTERSIRHMMYVVSGEFVRAYSSHGFINANTKWRARREVVEWLQSLVSMNRPLSGTLFTPFINDGSFFSSFYLRWKVAVAVLYFCDLNLDLQ